MTDRRVIYKYPFRMDGATLEIPWSSASRILHVAAQPAEWAVPTIWVEQDAGIADAAKPESRSFELRPTGLTYLAKSNLEFIATAVCQSGALVWHVFGSDVEVAF